MVNPGPLRAITCAAAASRRSSVIVFGRATWLLNHGSVMAAHPVRSPSRVRPVTWRPRLIALDIDGTITPVGREDVAPAVRAAIKRAVDHGAHVVLSTGRSLIGTRPVVE